VCGVDHTLTIGHVIDFMDEDCALFRQLIHNIAVVDDLATNVDRRTEGFQRNFNDVDGTDHAGAEAARFQQKYPLLIGGKLAWDTIGDRVKGSCSHPTIISICQEFTWVRTDKTHVFGYAFCCAWAFTFSDMVVSF
jgi:hypothetical protein